MATGHDVSPDELGGADLHATVTGYADAVADTDEQALDLIRRFLSYLPANSRLQPPRTEVPDGSDEGSKGILDLLPEESRRIYDVRPVIQSIVDVGTFFEVKARFAPCLTTGLARIDGRTVGVIANNPRHKVGTLDAPACDKATSFIVLCDSFNIPLVFLADQPGFLIGRDAECAGILGKVINWMQALSLCTVPVFSIITRKSYGQAFVNMGAGGMSSEVAAWWLADVSFMSPESAARIVYGADPDADPDGYSQRVAEMALDNSAYSLAANFGAHDVIDPRETRDYLKSMLDIYDPSVSGVTGKHLLGNWPSSYR
jgi:acetyl-CoA carboxylase carboxyltransferase component